MTDAAAPGPRFEFGRVLAATGETLLRQRAPLLVAMLVTGAGLNLLGTRIDYVIAWIGNPVSEALHPILWPLHGLADSPWMLWLCWLLRILFWTAISTVTVTLPVWITLYDHRRQPVTLGGALMMLRRAFLPALLIEWLFAVPAWGSPLHFLLPFSNAHLLARTLLRLVVILLSAWFGVATSAVIQEKLGFREALARSAALTKGRRLILAGLTSGVALALSASGKPIHDLILTINVRPELAETAASLLLYEALFTVAIVFETVLYLEMRRLRDPFPPTEGTTAESLA